MLVALEAKKMMIPQLAERIEQLYKRYETKGERLAFLKEYTERHLMVNKSVIGKAIMESHLFPDFKNNHKDAESLG